MVRHRVVPLVVALVACGGESTPEAHEVASGPRVALAPFDGICAGRLLVDMPARRPLGYGSPSFATVPAGTIVLLDSVGWWRGGAGVLDGEPFAVWPDDNTAFVDGRSFVTACTDPSVTRRTLVFLRDATFHEDGALLGPPCVVPGGTTTPMESAAFSIGPVQGWLDSSLLRDRCGFEKGYTRDFAFSYAIAEP